MRFLLRLWRRLFPLKYEGLTFNDINEAFLRTRREVQEEMDEQIRKGLK